MNKSIYDLKLTLKQICEVLNVSHMTIYRWREKGMPFIKDGGSNFYLLKDIEQWLNEQGATNKIGFK